MIVSRLSELKEEDLCDINEKLEKNENELHLKNARLEELNEQYKQLKEKHHQKSRVLSELTSECLPLQVPYIIFCSNPLLTLKLSGLSDTVRSQTKGNQRRNCKIKS